MPMLSPLLVCRVCSLSPGRLYSNVCTVDGSLDHSFFFGLGQKPQVSRENFCTLLYKASDRKTIGSRTRSPERQNAEMFRGSSEVFFLLPGVGQGGQWPTNASDPLVTLLSWQRRPVSRRMACARYMDKKGNQYFLAIRNDSNELLSQHRGVSSSLHSTD